jgi:hypothetical protein
MIKEKEQKASDKLWVLLVRVSQMSESSDDEFRSQAEEE